jgi:hypothetical protein
MSPDQPSGLPPVDAPKARRSLRNGFITLVLAGALVVGLLLAVPGLKGVATTVSQMRAEWIVVAILLEVLSCASYVVACLQMFAPGTAAVRSPGGAQRGGVRSGGVAGRCR